MGFKITCLHTFDNMAIIHFLPFDPSNNWKTDNFEKMKKATGDIIILHLFTTNDDHMMYGS